MRGEVEAVGEHLILGLWHTLQLQICVSYLLIIVICCHVADQLATTRFEKRNLPGGVLMYKLQEDRLMLSLTPTTKKLKQPTHQFAIHTLYCTMATGKFLCYLFRNKQIQIHKSQKYKEINISLKLVLGQQIPALVVLPFLAQPLMRACVRVCVCVCFWIHTHTQMWVAFENKRARNRLLSRYRKTNSVFVCVCVCAQQQRRLAPSHPPLPAHSPPPT